MKFESNGPTIPDELVQAQERGEVLFVCGAGVSKAAGLPLFGPLVKQVYKHLGEDWSLHAAENAGMREDGKLYGQYDRVLRCLERRLIRKDPDQNRSIRERIRKAVRKALDPAKAVSLENHLALLELSRDENGQSRLLTTNFDTLFERAWFEQKQTEIASHAGVSLPPPRGAGFAGVLHLHGRLADPLPAEKAEEEPDQHPNLNLAETDLVLTSAEFGDAYLRSGWASRYVYDLARTHTLVLIGYQAEDPPMRYLLETLEADQERFPDLKPVYAFAPVEKDDEDLQRALWEAKGLTPILYPVAGHDHSALYNTLRQWRSYAEDPTKWRRERLTEIFKKGPKGETDHEMTECIALLGHGDASDTLAKLAPDAKWLQPLAERDLFKKGDTHWGGWAAAKIDDPEMVRACVPLPITHDVGREWVQGALDDSNREISSAINQAWRLILRQPPAVKDQLPREWFQALSMIERGRVDFEARSLVGSVLKPRLQFTASERHFVNQKTDQEAEQSEIQFSDLMRVDFESAVSRSDSCPSPEEILNAWPTDAAAVGSLLNTLDRVLLEALEEAEDVGFLSVWDGASADVPSVARHAQNEYHSGFYPIARMIADLWEQLATLDPAAARATALRWQKSPFKLVQRLWLFALHDPVFDADFAAREVLELGDDVFWGSHAPVEIMRFLVGRWSEIGEELRAEIEHRFRLGDSMSADGPEDDGQAAKRQLIRDHLIFRRLARLEDAGCELTQDSVDLLEQIRQRHPEWKSGPDDRDDFSSWGVSFSEPVDDKVELASVPEDRLVDEAMRLQREGGFRQSGLWYDYCKADPSRALQGLLSKEGNGNWAPEAWCDLIAATMNVETDGVQESVAAALIEMPEATLREILQSAALWLQRQREAIGENFFTLWDKVATLAFSEVEGDPEQVYDDSDVMFEAINRPGGMLAEALLDALRASQPQRQSGLAKGLLNCLDRLKNAIGRTGLLASGRLVRAPLDASQPAMGLGLPKAYRKRLNKLMKANGREGLLARVWLAHMLNYLYSIDPEWAGQNLMDRLMWAHPEAGALWQGYAKQRISRTEIFNRLKPAMFQALEERTLGDNDLYNILVRLINVAIWKRCGKGAGFELEEAELKRALTRGPEGLRRDASRVLWRCMGDLRQGSDGEMLPPSAVWSDVVGPLFSRIWPLDANLRDEDTSANLVNMVLETGEAFPSAVDVVSVYLTPYQLGTISSSLRLDERHDALVKTHPRDFLRLASVLINPDAHPVPRDLRQLLDDCVAADESVKQEDAYGRLYALSRKAYA
ncbi:SIR2 family protein [Pseudovibrio exalbescens]|uniref:SIR2 family protein n=1 Tax=Pseudovibrio exalbescens TaxID=197461 RepID=UPI000C9A60F3|nr:SIR2 family protein [Pseudovibrio exalbescens]